MPAGVYVRTKEHKKIIKEAAKKSFEKGRIPNRLGKHHTKTTKRKMSLNLKGKMGCEARNWKGGRFKRFGYIFIYMSQHPFCDSNKYIREHRLVVERIIGRYLKPEEKVHHLAKTDNNNPEKLMAFINHSAHKRFELGGIVKSNEIIFDGRLLLCSKNI